MIRTNRKHGSIFKHFFAILALMIVLAMTLNMAVIFFVHERLLKEILNSQERFIDHYATSIDEAFEGIEHIFAYLQNSTELEKRKNAAYFERKDMLVNEKAIQSALRTYTAISPNIVDIFIYFFDYPYLYTNGGVVTPEVYYENRFEGEPAAWMAMLEEQYDRMTLRKYEGDKKSDSYQYGSTKMLLPSMVNSGTYLLQSIKTTNQRVIGTICVALKEELISSIFRDENTIEDRQIFVRSLDGQTIAANRPAQELERTTSAISMDELRETGRYVSRQGLISYRLSDHMEMEYIVYTSKKALFQDFEYVFTVAMMVSVLSIVLLLVYAYYQSQRMYQPFRNILHHLGGAETQEDETDYIAKQVLQLLSANQMLNKTLESSGHFVLQAVLYKVIMGRPTIDDALQAAQMNTNEMKSGLFMLIIIRMDLPTDQEELFYTEYHDAFYMHLREYLNAWLMDTIETRSNEYTVVLSIQSIEEKERVIAALRRMHEAWSGRIPGAAYYIGVSHVVEGIHGLRSGYQQAINVLRKRPVQSEKDILYAGTTSDTSDIPSIPNDLELQLRDGLEKGAHAYIHAYVTDILERNWRSNITYEAFFSVCTVINRYLFRMVHNKDPLAQSRLIHLKTDGDIYSAQRCMEIVLSNLDMTAEILSSTQKMPVSFIDQAIDYVNAHFKENINLECVAQALGYSPNHLSRNFKLKSNVSFTDYLNGKRVVYAKELLISTRMNLQDMAAQCGMSSANQLIRVFEKYEGITPNEYRKREKRFEG